MFSVFCGLCLRHYSDHDRRVRDVEMLEQKFRGFKVLQVEQADCSDRAKLERASLTNPLRIFPA